MRVLIIKLTSMGDLMHAFPSLTDAVRHNPEITFDWVVDESFAEVPCWHPAVNQVITTAHRRWRKNLIACYKAGEFSRFYQLLNQQDYDVVIDMQSNLKSAFVSWLRKGNVHGYDKYSCREKPAHWAYHHHYSVGLRQHAIERQRELLADIFGYEKPSSESEYGVDLSDCRLPDIELSAPYVVFVHNASWPTKMWSEKNWQDLAQRVAVKGYSILLPCGNTQEQQRAQSIAQGCDNAIALPKLSLNEMAAIMKNAKAAVCSDTGLAHMAAVVGLPSITLYAVTDTLLIGTVGQHQQHIVANAQTLEASMNDIAVDMVWEKLAPLLPALL